MAAADEALGDKGEEGVARRGHHKVVGHAEGLGQGQDETGLARCVLSIEPSEVVEAATHSHVHVNVHAPVVPQDKVPRSVHLLDLVRVLFVRRLKKIGSLLFHKLFNLFVGPEHVLVRLLFDLARHVLFVHALSALVGQVPLFRNRGVLCKVVKDGRDDLGAVGWVVQVLPNVSAREKPTHPGQFPQRRTPNHNYSHNREYCKGIERCAPSPPAAAAAAAFAHPCGVPPLVR